MMNPKPQMCPLLYTKQNIVIVGKILKTNLFFFCHTALTQTLTLYETSNIDLCKNGERKWVFPFQNAT